MARTRPVIAILAILLLVIPILPQATQGRAVQTASPVIPTLEKSGFPNPAYNMGPGLPAIVYPNSTFTIILKNPLPSGVSVEGVYYLDAQLAGNKIVFYNITGNYTLINSTAIKIGGFNKTGLFDVLIKLSNGKTLFIARSLWVINNVSDIIRFMHITDLHFGAGWPYPRIGEDRRFTGYLLSQLLGVNMILNTGDEADTQASTQYINSVAFRYALAYNVPMIINPGNHDYPNNNFIKYYERTYGYRVIGGKLLIIFLNTGGERGYADWKNLQLMKHALEEYKNVPVKIVMIHHPVFYYQGQVYTWYGSNSSLLEDPHKSSNSILSYYWANNLTATRYFLKLIETYNVTLVLAGHIHRDQYVEYHSTKTGHITLFQTTTTLAYGSGTYQGFQVDQVNLTTGSITYPLAPPWFIGYENHSKRSVFNAIPLTTPSLTEHWSKKFDNTYLWGEYYEGKTALIITLVNNLPYLNINKTVILALPWPHGYKAHIKTLSTSGNAKISLVDQKYVDELGRDYVALHFNLPAKSAATFALYTVPDNNPPTAAIKAVLPSKPKSGNLVKVFLQVADDGWGVKSANINVKAVKGSLENLKIEKYTSDTYLIQFKDKASGGDTVLINVKAVDYAGNTLNKTLQLSIAGSSTGTGGGSSKTTTTTTETTSTTTTSTSTVTGTTTGTTGTNTSTTASGVSTTITMIAAISIVILAIIAAILIRK